MTPKVKGFLAVIALIWIASLFDIPIATQIMEMLGNLVSGFRNVGGNQ